MSLKNDLGGALLTLLLCAVVALGALAFVPSSPALILDEAVALLEFDTGLTTTWDEPIPLMVTAYGASIAGGCVLAVALLAVLFRLQGDGLGKGAAVAALCGVFALLGGHWLYCALRWSYIINDLAGDWSFPLQLWQGGFTMYGAVLGAVLGGVVAAWLTKESLPALLDKVVLGVLIVLIAGRLAEAFTCQGMANTRASEALQMLPFVTADDWGGLELAVYPYEALAALGALIAAAVVMLMRRPAGRAAEVGLAIVSAYQLLFESLRGDELIKFGFVCLNMLMAAAVLVAILVPRIVRTVKAQGWKPWTIARIVIFLAAIGIVIAIEFALDKSDINNTLLYAVMTAAILSMTASALIGDGRGEV